MMSLGSLGNGGPPSSTSNLSASAPPFTVGRSCSNPNSSPLVHFTEPPYAVPFLPSFHNWQHYSQSSSSGPDLYSNLDSEVDSIRTTSLPLCNDYQYVGGSHSASSVNPKLGTHMPPLNTNSDAATDAFTFLHYSSGMPSNAVESKPYYPPLVSPVVGDNIPLVTVNKTGYNLPSTSCAAPLDVTYPVDYAQSLSGWGSFWSRLADEELAKWVELERGFGLGDTNDAKQTNDPGSFVCEDKKNQGAYMDEGSECEKASAITHGKYVEVWGKEFPTVSQSTGRLNDKSSSLQDPMFISSESSRTSFTGSSSAILESHAQVQSLESTTNLWDNQNSYSAFHDKCFQPFDSYTSDHISEKRSCTAPFSRAPSTDTKSTVPNTVSSVDVLSIGEVAAADVKAKEKKSLLPLIYGKEGCLDTSRVSLNVERTDRVIFEKCPTSNEMKTTTDRMSKDGPEYQLPGVNFPVALASTPDCTKGFTTVEDSLESSDHCHPAVDSPCWKGAPASSSPLPKASQAVKACNCLNLQQAQIFPPRADDRKKVPWPKLCEKSVYEENEYVELGSLLCPGKPPNANYLTRDHDSADTGEAGYEYQKESCRNRVQISNDMNKCEKEHGMASDSKSGSDLKSPHTEIMNLDEGVFISERDFKLCANVVDTGLNTDITSGDGPLPFHGVESATNLSCSEDVNKLAKPQGTESTPKMNIQMLINGIHNLSELLLHCYSNDASALSEQNQKAIARVISILDACISKKNVNMIPSHEPVLPQRETSDFRDGLDLHKDAVSDRTSVAKEPGASSYCQFSFDCENEIKRNCNVSSKEVEKNLDLVSSGSDVGIAKDKVVQAIKGILEEDFTNEEEMESDIFLYKSLWLEAEAALCSISCRARFNRMKIEMEHRKLDKAKESTNTVEKLLNFKVSPHPNKVINEGSHNSKVPGDSKVIFHKVRVVEDSAMAHKSISEKTKGVDDVEASVMARFNILKSRGENSNSVSTDSQQLAKEVDTGFAFKLEHWPLTGNSPPDRGSLGMSWGSYLQYSSGKGTVEESGSCLGGSDQEAARECDVRASNDRVIEPCAKDRLGCQLPWGSV
ncbi:uncharacterized protein LOC127796864 isoform X2 [Diospyros lotus]|uniref:uncharacterized protein LOC127796864 isoform X2 n=1 Tax=Diospyros lotus TaxID=55363 RepID=UPI002254C517|nr:uncharacterized protein LOC127796864 isoform X2 [Diospyros lotus]